MPTTQTILLFLAAANLLRAGSRGERWMQRVSATVFIGLGLRLALPERR